MVAAWHVWSSTIPPARWWAFSPDGRTPVRWGPNPSSSGCLKSAERLARLLEGWFVGDATSPADGVHAIDVIVATLAEQAIRDGRHHFFAAQKMLEQAARVSPCGRLRLGAFGRSSSLVDPSPLEFGSE
jgi:hypothetical protein